jgi:hypothetical protein
MGRAENRIQPLRLRMARLQFEQPSFDLPDVLGALGEERFAKLAEVDVHVHG